MMNYLPYRKKDSAYKKYGTFNRRMLAATFDSLILYFMVPLFDWIAPIQHSAINNTELPANAENPSAIMLQRMLTNEVFMRSWIENFGMQIACYFLISAICWHYWAATPGKILMRLKIVDAKTEEPIRTHQILLRLCGYVMSGCTFMLGFLWIGMNKKHRGWHDYLADTTVIIQPWTYKWDDAKKDFTRLKAHFTKE